MQGKEINKAVALLIQVIKVSILQNVDIESIKINNNWQQIIRLSAWHGINPVFSACISEFKIQSKFIKWFQNLAKENAISNLISSKEYNEVVQVLGKYNLDFLTYKGHLFLSELYNGRQLREIGDLDIIVDPKNASEIIEILLQNGYQFNDVSKDCNLSQHELVDLIPKTIGMNETTLTKKINATKSYIDFHWGFHYSFLPYQIDLKWLFSDKKTTKINNIQSQRPSDEAIFTMLIIHHGGRDTWMKLKYMVDLLAFMETKGSFMNWPKMIEKLAEMKLKRPALMGFFLLKTFFEYEIPSVIEAEFEKERINEELAAPIIDYWENCYDILSLKGRLKYERILWSIQDEGFSRWTYIKEMFKMYSIPNPIESKRLVTFPENYYFLNAASKVITYLWKRGFGKITR